MVSKLSFKNSKKNKAKRSPDANAENGPDVVKRTKHIPRDEDLMMINNKLTDITTLDPQAFETGWSTANSTRDLNGPAIILPVVEKESLFERALSFNEAGKSEISDKLTKDADAINFNGYHDDSPLQKLEPNASTQVVVLNDVIGLVGSKKDLQESKLNKRESVKLSLKSKDGLFVSAVKDDIQCNGTVLTNDEIFVFTRVIDQEDKIRWQIKTLDGRKLYLLDRGEFKLIQDDEDLVEQKFVIRVHIKNTVNAKKIKLLQAEQHAGAGEA